MKFSIAADLLDKYPLTHVGLVFIKGCNNKTVSPELAYILKESENRLRSRMEGKELLDLPELKLWRETYRSFGAKKGRRVSIEAMAKRVIKGDTLPNISPLVDLYNSVSLRYVFPCGGEDLAHVKGNVTLGFATGNESFYRIGGDENEPPLPGEVVYKDDDGCLCRCWNWREADRTKLTEETQDAVLVIETLDPSRNKEFVDAMSHMADLVKTLTGAETEMYVLNKKSPEIEYELSI